MMPKHKRITPCDTCRMFAQLMYPGLVCRDCIASGRYAEQKRMIESKCKSANA